MQFLFWSHQQDQRCRLGRTFESFFSLSELPLQRDKHEAKRHGAWQGTPAIWVPSPWFL